MKKALFMALAFLFVFWLFLMFGTRGRVLATDDTHILTHTTTIISYISLDLSGPAADTVAFGNLAPGTPICYSTGTVATVDTNADNGYTLGVHDSTVAPGSSMTHTDTFTHIPKMTIGTIATPVAWVTNYGVGITMYAADSQKEAKWVGTSVCDAANTYAAIPETATTAHTVTGVLAAPDTSSWGFTIDTQNTQKTGDYSGTMTFTATAVII